MPGFVVPAIAAAAVLVTATALAFLTMPVLDQRRFNGVVSRPPCAINGASSAASEPVVANLHAGPLLWKRNLLQDHSFGHIDLPRLTEGNVCLQVFVVPAKAPMGLNYQRNNGYSDLVTLLTVVRNWPPPAWYGLSQRALAMAARP